MEIFESDRMRDHSIFDLQNCFFEDFLKRAAPIPGESSS
jgi:hypothetical protein